MTAIQERIAELLVEIPREDDLELAQSLAPALLATCLVITGKNTEAALELVSTLINEASKQWQKDTNE